MQSSSLHNPICAHVFVSGRVQGVGYRMSTYEVAKDLGVSGWVRNLPDGRVEAIFEGTRDVVEDMIAWCRRSNPPVLVKDVVVEYEAPQSRRGFEIRR